MCPKAKNEYAISECSNRSGTAFVELQAKSPCRTSFDITVMQTRDTTMWHMVSLWFLQEKYLLNKRKSYTKLVRIRTKHIRHNCRRFLFCEQILASVNYIRM